MEKADLSGAQLAGATLSHAELEYADLRNASLDKTTLVDNGVLLDQVTLDNPNLTIVEWDRVPVLGDELQADRNQHDAGKPKALANRANDYAAAARAYRLLMVAPQGKGLGDVAARYAERVLFGATAEERVAAHIALITSG